MKIPPIKMYAQQGVFWDLKQPKLQMMLRTQQISFAEEGQMLKNSKIVLKPLKRTLKRQNKL